MIYSARLCEGDQKAGAVLVGARELIGARDEACAAARLFVRLAVLLQELLGTLDGFLSRSPTFLGGEALQPGNGTTHRGALAGWMTSPKNPYFARAMVNRM